MDKYYVYRPLLDLIKKFEGTVEKPKARGYNTTLSYDAYTGGPVDLVKMTLAQVDALQGRMLAHPKNKWNSSAAGAYQIVRKTRRGIETKLKLDKSSLYDEDMQDRMACFLLGQRGIDKWLAGRLTLDTLLRNLSKEWASLPGPNGKGAYSGQNSSVSVMQVSAALSEVKRRHEAGQPKIEVPVEVEKPVVPEAVETKVKKETGLWGWLTTGAGGWGGQGGSTGGSGSSGGVGAAGVVFVLEFL